MPDRRPVWWPVARWELVRILRRKDFLISIAITPFLVFAFTFLTALFEHRGDHRVAVARIDSDGSTRRGPAALPPLAGFRWVDPGPAGADTSAMIRAVRSRSYEAGLIVHSQGEGDWRADLVTRREPSRWSRDLRDHLASAARVERARALGLSDADLQALDDSVAIRSHVAVGGRTGGRRADFLVTFGVLILMVSVLLTSMSYMMVGISGEKQARVTEVVLSAIPAQAWMDGKIVAFTAVGLITGFAWTATLAILSGPLAFRLPSSVNPANLAITAVFALLGLYLYNAFISGLMASAQNLQTASKWQGNFIMLPFLPVVFLGGLLENPDSAAMVVLSMIPFFAPAMIPARLVLGAVQPWELALAFALLVAGCWWTRRFAGRVFRLGMLMYGKDMTLPELIRWARVK